jgi:anti-sigma B factor antagonist
MRAKPAKRGPRPAPFQIRGEIDLSNADDLARQLEQYAATTTGDLVVDCRDMTFIDSSGLGTLIRAEQQLAEFDRHVVLERLRPHCRRAFELGGVDTFLAIRRSA